MDKIIANERLAIRLLTFEILCVPGMSLAWMEFKRLDFLNKFNALEGGKNLKSGTTA
jgi:hypothetical protein